MLLQLELLSSHDQNEPPPAQDSSVDPATLGATLASSARAARAISIARRACPRRRRAEDRDARRTELDALLSRCLKCHEYDPSGARLAPVRLAEPVMPRSIFNHAPHTTQTACETCHGVDGKTSKLATDVNVPGVAGLHDVPQTQRRRRPSARRVTSIIRSRRRKLLAVTR